VAVASRVELPSLVAERWATEAVVAAVTGESVVLRGVGRLRLRSATGKEPPYPCEAERVPEAGFAPAPAELLAAVHEAVAALQINPIPDEPGGPARVESVAAAVLRAAGAPAGRRGAAGGAPVAGRRARAERG